MKEGKEQTFHYSWRFYSLVFLLICILMVLLWRMVDLTIIDRQFLQQQGNARSLRDVKIPAYRGMIADRNGVPLAVSTPVEAVWVNPQELELTPVKAKALSQLLDVPTKLIRQRATQSTDKEFVYLKRGIVPAIAKRVKDLNIRGVYLQGEFKRFYPEGEATSHILGFTNIDDSGQEGLELAYNDWLEGKPGKKRVIKDRLGHIISDEVRIREPRPGQNLVLSIDKRLQYIAYQELKDSVEKYDAVSGSIVVLDAKTGEILAMTNLPSFNPNIRPGNNDGRYRNRAVTDVFEPGSVIKAFSIASVLESGKYTANSVIDTRPSWMMVDGNTIRDDRANGVINVTQILQKSSNVGVTKLTLSLPAKHLIDVLRGVGFGQRSGSGFPGESAGVLVDHPKWRPFVLATLGFGYGLSVTTLQLAHAYTVFAQHGKLLPVSLLRKNVPPKGTPVIKPDVADTVLKMLETVVEDNGTGKRAKVKGYRIAGKTGTARIANAQGYASDRHVATFVGMAPASDPRLVIAVMINDPRAGKYYGGLIAAPLFSKVMARSLRTLGIAPDKA